MKRKLSRTKSGPDIRPRDQRENKLHTRKGMKRDKETVNISFLEHQTKIDEFENQI